MKKGLKKFKTKRKLFQKLQRKGFCVKDSFKVFDKYEKLNSKLENTAISIVVSDVDSDEIEFSTPTMWLSNKHNTDSLFPYKVILNEENLYEDISRFLSIATIVKKFSK